MSAAEPNENPLIRNNRLRQMYLLLLEAQMLEERQARRHQQAGRRPRRSALPDAAGRVATMIELGAEDVVSDSEASFVLELLLGGEAGGALLENSAGRKALKDVEPVVAARLLAPVKDDEDRVRLAVGAALALKARGKAGTAVVYARGGAVRGGAVRSGALDEAAWKRVLPLAARLDLPMIFVVLPSATERAGKNRPLYELARRCGMPGIPVDAMDAVALYRVTQESLGRTRIDGGPVLIECVRYRVEGSKAGANDAAAQMRELLLARKVCDAAWLAGTERSARERVRKLLR